MSVAAEEGRNRRAYFRVDGDLWLRHFAIAPDELEEVRRRLRSQPSEPTATSHEQLLVHLARLEHKLDRVLALLDPGIEPPLCELDLRSLEISASGVRYPWPEAVASETRLLVELALPETPPRLVQTIARVVRCSPVDAGAGYDVAVEFLEIDEADRDAIVRYVLKLQREARQGEGEEEAGE